MSREKQIEEIAKVMCRNRTSDGNCITDNDPCGLECVYGYCAERIYSAGYRKQSEGEWILIGNGNGRRIHWKCSVCGFETLDASNGDTNFCPNCGADMRGGAE